MGSGISPLNYLVGDQDQKHGIGDHRFRIGDQVKNLRILGSFTRSGIKISLKSGLKNQNYLKIARSTGPKYTMLRACKNVTVRIKKRGHLSEIYSGTFSCPIRSDNSCFVVRTH